MYWSKYNIVFESPYGRFIYNTFTNNLMEMNASLISCIDKITTVPLKWTNRSLN